LGHYNYSGTYLLVTGIVAAVLGLERTRPRWHRVVLWVVVAACVYGVFLTQSRGAWLAMVLLYLFWIVVNLHGVWRRVVAMAGVVAGYFLLPPFYQERFASILYPWRDVSFMQRVDAWKFAASLYEQHPVLGYGLATYQTWCLRLECPAPIGHPHNAYLHFLFEAGPASLLLLLAFLGLLLRDLWRRRKDSPFAQTGLLAVLALMVHGMVGLTFRDEQLAAALALAALGLAQRAPSEPGLKESDVGPQEPRP
jgi:O-antigen ligase